MQPTIDVVAVGETMAQLTPLDGSTVGGASKFQLRAAGAESNLANGLVQLGSRAAWVSRLGADAVGRRVLAEIADAGVNTSGVRLEPGGRTGLFVKDPSQESSAVVYYRDGSAASHLDRDDIEVALRMRPTFLHLTGITPALSPSCRDAVEYAMIAARGQGVQVSFDVNHRAALWDECGSDELLRLSRLADVVFVGLDEAQSLWQCRSAGEVRELMPEVPILVVKDGGRDATSFEKADVCTVDALVVEVLEPVGAGDAFAAGWLHAALLGMSPVARLRLGHLMAGAALTSLSDHFVLGDEAKHFRERAAGNWP